LAAFARVLVIDLSNFQTEASSFDQFMAEFVSIGLSAKGLCNIVSVS
jgi:hypothetical protein